MQGAKALDQGKLSTSLGKSTATLPTYSECNVVADITLQYLETHVYFDLPIQVLS